MDKNDEVTLRLTITGLYSAIRKYYDENVDDDSWPTNEEMAKADQESWNDRVISLHDLVDWFDETSDIQVKIEVAK